MRITNVEVFAIGRPEGFASGGEGEFLVTPLHMFPDAERILGDQFVGVRGGDVYAVLAKVHTDEGLTGIGSAGVGSGAATFIIEQHLRPIVMGQNPFDVERLWEQMF